MSTPTAYGRRLAARARDVPPLVADAAIASACVLSVTVVALVDDRLQWWIVALATLNALPLIWRRRYPFTVTTVTGTVTTGLAIADVLGELPAAQLVATYTFAALCPPLLRLIAMLGTLAGVSVSVLVPHQEVLAIGEAMIMFVVAYALGTGARARRNRIALLEERARRLAEEHDAAATRERERIAREMHDILAHSMSLVVVQAEAGPVAVRTDPDKAEEVFDTISATAREALAQLRRTLGLLRAGEPDRAPQPGLAALPQLVDSVNGAGLAAHLQVGGEPRPLPPDLAATAYRIVQESLTNTVKHAGAGTVTVRLQWRDGALDLAVRDDGRGPPASGGTEGGQGLVGMRERVAAAGGELTTGTGPDGTGFHVTATLPLQ